MRRILWFRRDLRIEDNPLLSYEGEVFPLFIFDTNILSRLSADDRRVTFIFKAVMKLKKELYSLGLDLAIFYGNPVDVFKKILHNRAFDEVCASGDYDTYAYERDRDISHLLPFTFVDDTYLFRPDEVLKSDGTPYLVFTPYYNRAKALYTIEHQREYTPVAQELIAFEYDSLHTLHRGAESLSPLSLEEIGFTPQTLTTHQLLSPHEKLEIFSTKLSEYSDKRNTLALSATSELGIDLRFGTLSIRSILRWLAVQKKKGVETEPFFRQLIFRDFYAMLLYHFPHLATRNFRYPFKGVENSEYFEAFCHGKTGVPLVDAGIEQLLKSGEMHNRVRMICGSFFTKNLLLPWQWGEAFFAQHLLDYDAASNILSWQWCAGTGVDPQPYFRIFNPYTQTKKFDSSGEYIKRHLPKLTDAPIKALSDETWLMRYPLSNYPPPIVSHPESSRRALEYFKSSL